MTFELAGRTINVFAILGIAAVVQWLAFVTMSFFSRARLPKEGLRDSERKLLVSTAIAAAVWIGVAATADTGAKPKVAAASAAAKSASRGSCATLEVGMASDKVRSRMGKPDEIRNQETVRGPGAEAWIYRDSRCAVHVIDGKVEFIE